MFTRQGSLCVLCLLACLALCLAAPAAPAAALTRGIREKARDAEAARGTLITTAEEALAAEVSQAAEAPLAAALSQQGMGATPRDAGLNNTGEAAGAAQATAQASDEAKAAAQAAGYAPGGAGYETYVDAYRYVIDEGGDAEAARAAGLAAAKAVEMAAADKELLALACASAGGSSIAACAGALSAGTNVQFGNLAGQNMADSLRESQSAGKRADVQGRLTSLSGGGGGAGIYGFSVDLSKSSSNISGGYMVGSFKGGTGSYNLHSGTGQMNDSMAFGIGNFQGAVTLNGAPVGDVGATLFGNVGSGISGYYVIEQKTPSNVLTVDYGIASSGNVTIAP
ncbi:hypothetical protein LJC15_03480 [Desulfovibrio sp. OttesenSCG-928-G11]|nr:hypothetical protein [Desulfovibrio sp. OttesenSCG-928-G11]